MRAQGSQFGLHLICGQRSGHNNSVRSPGLLDLVNHCFKNIIVLLQPETVVFTDAYRNRLHGIFTVIARNRFIQISIPFSVLTLTYGVLTSFIE